MKISFVKHLPITMPSKPHNSGIIEYFNISPKILKLAIFSSFVISAIGGALGSPPCVRKIAIVFFSYDILNSPSQTREYLLSTLLFGISVLLLVILYTVLHEILHVIVLPLSITKTNRTYIAISSFVISVYVDAFVPRNFALLSFLAPLVTIQIVSICVFLVTSDILLFGCISLINICLSCTDVVCFFTILKVVPAKSYVCRNMFTKIK